MTIIILLILAGITISLTIGQRGILNRAQEAGKNYQEAAKKEDEELSNFLKVADDIGNGINVGGTTPSTPEISEAVKGLKAGNYIKYNTGVSSVGENGVIVCRVLYPVDSEYGLQIISDKNIGNITLDGRSWETGKVAYNGAIGTLNKKAEKYVNTEYAYDGRCVGSIPTVQNGMFIDKDKGAKTTISIQSSWIIPNVLEGSRDTGCYNMDENYLTDYEALGTTMKNIGEKYWLASHYVDSYVSHEGLHVRNVDINGNLFSDCICYVYSNGEVGGYLHAYGLRPCISLKSDIIKITGGDGTSPETAYTIGL